MKLRTTFALAATLFASQAQAVNVEHILQNFLDESVKSWASAPEIISAIQAQNLTTAGFNEAHILTLDSAWQSEVGGDATPMIDQVLNNAAADFLRSKISQMDNVVTEVFIMDSMGLNVAASGVTSDYWQGDEAKFTQTFPNGPDAVHFSDVDFDESSQTYQAQISMTIVDPSNGTAIGAMTVGVLADNLD